MEIPGRGEQGEAADQVRPTLRRRYGQGSPHAIPGQHGRSAGQTRGRGHRALHAAGNVVGQAETAFGFPRPTPVQQQRPHALAGQPAQHRIALRQIEHVGPVDQAGDEQHRPGRRRPIVQQPRAALRPDRGRVDQVTVPGMPPVGGDALDQCGILA